MGLVAGSSVMVLTALWGSCLIAGRCDLVEHSRTHLVVAKDRTLTKGFSLTETGVTTDKQTMWASWVMVATLLPYLVAQIPRLFGLNTEGHAFIAVAAGIAVANLIGYCIYQIAAPWIQERRIDFAKQRFRRSHAFFRASHFSKKQGWGSLFKSNGEPDEEVLMKLFNHFDEEKDGRKDGHLSQHELKGLLVGLGVERHNGAVPDEDEVKHWMTEFDISNDGKISSDEFLKGIMHWMKSSNSQKKRKPSQDDEGSHSGRWDTEAQAAKAELALLSDENEEDDDDDEEDHQPPSKNQIILKAVGYLILGAAVAAIFADPLVDAIGGFSKASGISPFFISFIATPLATNSSEAISSLIFAKRKRKRTISMTYSQIYGAVTMNNTMCLGIFLAIVYFRHLLWDFSAEISVIFFAVVIMGLVAAFRTTFQLWMAFIGLALYPLSIALVAFLDYVCGWH
ncbi:hypothetical protein M758_4G009100 [Ceratodon purpureus]|nr:hypothetical protein M758_4G009100 [Ceratodon purpureus]